MEGSWRPFSRSAPLLRVQEKWTSPDRRAQWVRVAMTSWGWKLPRGRVAHPCLPWMPVRGITGRLWGCRRSTRASERGGSSPTAPFSLSRDGLCYLSHTSRFFILFIRQCGADRCTPTSNLARNRDPEHFESLEITTWLRFPLLLLLLFFF